MCKMWNPHRMSIPSPSSHPFTRLSSLLPCSCYLPRSRSLILGRIAVPYISPPRSSARYFAGSVSLSVPYPVLNCSPSRPIAHCRTHAHGSSPLPRDKITHLKLHTRSASHALRAHTIAGGLRFGTDHFTHFCHERAGRTGKPSCRGHGYTVCTTAFIAF